MPLKIMVFLTVGSPVVVVDPLSWVGLSLVWIPCRRLIPYVIEHFFTHTNYEYCVTRGSTSRINFVVSWIPRRPSWIPVVCGSPVHGNRFLRVPFSGFPDFRASLSDFPNISGFPYRVSQ